MGQVKEYFMPERQFADIPYERHQRFDKYCDRQCVRSLLSQSTDTKELIHARKTSHVMSFITVC